MQGRGETIAQQIDIMPTVLGYLGYDESYIAFGNDLLNTTSDQHFAVNHNNGIYQYFKGDYMLQFDGEKSIAVFTFKTDRLLQNNLLNQLPEQQQMEKELKAIIQRYRLRMNGDKMTIE